MFYRNVRERHSERGVQAEQRASDPQRDRLHGVGGRQVRPGGHVWTLRDGPGDQKSEAHWHRLGCC